MHRLNSIIFLKLCENPMSMGVLGQNLWLFTLQQKNGNKSTKNKCTKCTNLTISKNGNGRGLELSGIFEEYFTIIISA